MVDWPVGKSDLPRTGAFDNLKRLHFVPASENCVSWMGPQFAYRDSGIFGRPFPGSVRFDVGRPDHLGPFFGVISDELSERRGRSLKYGDTQIGKPRLDLGIG